MDIIVTAASSKESLELIFNAIASLFSSGALKNLALLLMLISLFIALITFQGRPGGGLYLIGRWFLLLLFFYSLFDIKTTVHFKSGPGSSVTNIQGHVDHVPFAVAFFGSLFTQLDYGIARLFDTAFSIPTFTSSANGVGFSALSLYFKEGQDAVLKVVGANERYHIDNLNLFFDNCIVKTMMQGYISMSNLQQAGWVGVSYLVNPAFYTPIKASNTEEIFVSCLDARQYFEDAYNYLASLGNASAFYKYLFPSADSGALTSIVASGASSAISWLSGGSIAGGPARVLADAATYNFFMNSLARNSVNPASFAEGFTKVAGESCMQGAVSQRYLPMLKTVMLYLVFGVLPLMFMFLLTPMWKPTLISIGTVGLWFSMWSALTAVFNGLVGIFAKRAFESMLSSNAFTSNSVMASVAFVNNYTDYMCMAAGYASYIPVIALALASGSMYALTHVAQGITSTVKAAGDRTTDAWDFATPDRAGALAQAQASSIFKQASASMAQVEASAAFAGGLLREGILHNRTYGSILQNQLMLGQYGITAGMEAAGMAIGAMSNYANMLQQYAGLKRVLGESIHQQAKASSIFDSIYKNMQARLGKYNLKGEFDAGGQIFYLRDINTNALVAQVTKDGIKLNESGGVLSADITRMLQNVQSLMKSGVLSQNASYQYVHSGTVGSRYQNAVEAFVVKEHKSGQMWLVLSGYKEGKSFDLYSLWETLRHLGYTKEDFAQFKAKFEAGLSAKSSSQIRLINLSSGVEYGTGHDKKMRQGASEESKRGGKETDQWVAEFQRAIRAEGGSTTTKGTRQSEGWISFMDNQYSYMKIYQDNASMSTQANVGDSAYQNVSVTARANPKDVQDFIFERVYGLNKSDLAQLDDVKRNALYAAGLFELAYNQDLQKEYQNFLIQRYGADVKSQDNLNKDIHKVNQQVEKRINQGLELQDIAPPDFKPNPDGSGQQQQQTPQQSTPPPNKGKGKPPTGKWKPPTGKVKGSSPTGVNSTDKNPQKPFGPPSSVVGKFYEDYLQNRSLVPSLPRNTRVDQATRYEQQKLEEFAEKEARRELKNQQKQEEKQRKEQKRLLERKKLEEHRRLIVERWDEAQLKRAQRLGIHVYNPGSNNDKKN